ncbi:MAG: type VI secretion system contractile sheath large subunit, partial [Gammaproteobacteria bacterium]|nr:type VI secretion system contractile sheath large subunit [Gammaproteobacteria bacterium]
MAENKINLGGVHMGTHIDGAQQGKPLQDTPFHTLVISPFCGNHDNCKPSPQMVDKDNFDEVIAKFSPELSLSLNQDSQIKLRFQSLDDFHPDALYQQVALFSQLKQLRNRLNNQNSFAEAAREMGAYTTEPAPQAVAETETTGMDAASVLDMTLNTTDAQISEQQNPDNLAKNLIQDIIAPYIIPAPDPKKDELVNSVDQSISALMNSILHHPDFQKLEASWRALYLLISRSETDSKLKVFIYHTRKADVLRDFSESEITDSRFYKTLLEPYSQTPGGIPWSSIVLDFEITASPLDVLLLDIMSQLAASSNACLLAQGSNGYVGIDSLSETPDSDDWGKHYAPDFTTAWDNLRTQSYAQYLGLCYPRFLLRIPYGQNTRPIESFNYEEMENNEHNDLLWGNSAYAIALLLNQAYSKAGWSLKPGQERDVTR